MTKQTFKVEMKHEKGRVYIKRKFEGYSYIELLGMIELLKQDLIKDIVKESNENNTHEPRI